MAAFVTVGTTCFNDLIREVNKPLFRETLIKYGYKKLFIQYGNGSIPPEEFVDTSVPLNIITFSFHENLDSIFSQCSLIICHGGAGTCMEALTPPGKRKLIIVINESLMNNHQEELASTLYEGKHAFVTRPPNLVEFLTTGNQPPFLECQVLLASHHKSVFLENYFLEHNWSENSVRYIDNSNGYWFNPLYSWKSQSFGGLFEQTSWFARCLSFFYRFFCCINLRFCRCFFLFRKLRIKCISFVKSHCSLLY